jgi:hypothetical protein
MCRAASDGSRLCPSCLSYPAAARRNGNRRLTRLARRRVADFLTTEGLPDTAAAVLAAPPSVLPALMAALGIDQTVLGDVRMPDDRRNGVSADAIIAQARAERAARAIQLRRRRREMERLARRRVVDFLKAKGLPRTAALVMTTSPSILPAFMAALGIDKTVLGDIQMPEATPFVGAANKVIDHARAELAQRVAAPTCAPSRRRLSVADVRGPRQTVRDAARLKGPAALPTNCRAQPDVLIKWEQRAEQTFSTGSRAQTRTALAEAEMFCKGCPLAQSCAETAKSTGYTGLAGGRIFVDGRHRSKPSLPGRTVA